MQSTHHSSHSTSDRMMAPSQSSSTNTSSTSTFDPDVKILQDLSTLSEQIALCQSMLITNNHRRTMMDRESDDSNEALLTVIGFLEACTPRMLDLIEIAAQGGGVLKDETFEECLVVNDKLTTILADLDNPPSNCQNNSDSRGIGAAAAAVDGGDNIGGGLSTFVDADTINLSMQNLTMGEVAGGKTTGLDDDLLGIGLDDHDLLSSPATLPPPSAAFPSDSQTEAQDASNDNDDFDSFFKDRTSAP